MDVPVLDPADIIDVDSEEELNQTGTITSTYDFMVKYVHNEDIDDNLDDDDEDIRSALGEGRREVYAQEQDQTRTSKRWTW